MKTVCELNQCAGCMACIDTCPKSAITIEDEILHYNAVINPDKCINCNSCQRVCQELHTAKKRVPVFWKQGWTNETDRARSSSGGLAYALAKSFIESGGMVAACVFNEGIFGFQLFDTTDDLDLIRGSKYVKSDPTGVFKRIKEALKDKKVLFIGLPCQVSSLLNFVGEFNDDYLYTVDLVCHGTPSPQIIADFFEESHLDIKETRSISFRKNNIFRLTHNGLPFSQPFNMDAYSIAFLNSICYTDNCYSCKYASWERVSDITLGDSWGSELDEVEREKGISIVLCQTSKGKELIEASDLTLMDVDKDMIIRCNHQLSHPSIKTSKHDIFMKSYLKDRKVSKAVRRCFPKHYIKQFIKTCLHLVFAKDWMP